MNPYNKAFYDAHEQLSLSSAKVMLGLLFARFRPASVVDVGCGLGTWLGACREAGIEDVLGVDGPHVDQARLHVPADRFRALDLQKPFALGRRFDLAIALEVAEHLEGPRAVTFVADLTAHSDIVLFSAAIPHQRGAGHVNENWVEYWADKFRAHGYEIVDLFRAQVWEDPRVAFWYRQNVFLFVRASRLADLGLRLWSPGDMPLSAIHPEMFLWACSRDLSGSAAFERDKSYWRATTAAYRAGARVVDPVPGYGPEKQGMPQGVRRLFALLKRAFRG